MATYSYSTFLAARQQIAARLYDSGEVFWSDTEIKQYVWEALRTWNALTSFWRNDFLFNPTINQNWYDLTTLPGSLRPITLTDQSLYTIIQYHLLEPVAWNPWAGASLQFTATDLLNAVNRRQDELQSLAAATLTRNTVPAPAGRITLSDSVIDIRRLAYYPTAPGTSPSTVWPDDMWAEQSFNRSYLQKPSGTPSTYLQTSQPPISFDPDINPGFAGNYEVVTVNAGPSLSVSTASALVIPDDWAWIIKWGALADLLSRESNAKDVPRATYCEQRYRMGVALLTKAPALLQLRADNVPVQIDSVWAADLYNTSWEALTSGPTVNAYTAGLNLFALSPAPDLNTYSYTATVVQNAPLPSADGDPIQVSRDDYDAIIDYAQHLAAFKMGGQEFLQTTSLLQRFLQQCTTYGLKLAEIAEYTSVIYALSNRDKEMHPIMSPGPADTSTVGGAE